MTEEITWHRVADELPDSDQTVLVHCPGADDPVTLGYHDGETWWSADYISRRLEVTAWAEMPKGVEG